MSASSGVEIKILEDESQPVLAIYVDDLKGALCQAVAPLTAAISSKIQCSAQEVKGADKERYQSQTGWWHFDSVRVPTLDAEVVVSGSNKDKRKRAKVLACIAGLTPEQIAEVVSNEKDIVEFHDRCHQSLEHHRPPPSCSNIIHSDSSGHCNPIDGGTIPVVARSFPACKAGTPTNKDDSRLDRSAQRDGTKGYSKQAQTLDAHPRGICSGLNDHSKLVPLESRKAFHKAALSAQAKQVQDMIATNPHILESRDGNGGTALFRAAEVGCLDGVVLLTREGASINASNNDGSTPLDAAIYFGKMHGSKGNVESSSACCEVAMFLIDRDAARQPQSNREASSQKLWNKADRYRLDLDPIKASVDPICPAICGGQAFPTLPRGADLVQSKCASPNCAYRSHSDATWIANYCCKRCKQTAGQNHGTRCELTLIRATDVAQRSGSKCADNSSGVPVPTTGFERTNTNSSARQLELSERASGQHSLRKKADISQDDNLLSSSEVDVGSTAPLNRWFLADMLQSERRLLRRLDPAQNGVALKNWSHLMGIYDITDRRLRSTHSTVSPTFRHGPHGGQSVADLVSSFMRKEQQPMDLTPLVAVDWRDALWVVFGNRRMWALREYISKHGPFKDVPQVRIIVHKFPFDHLQAREKIALKLKALDAMSSRRGGLHASMR
eukprot:TRINITY_DN74916_c0_g1_i1.p1 TRINITY_DN74916_c0_g1~~TRINITY_DN74916_c0_g1_i1.p1  ORF type:complete len:670 (+),score=94.92 TRINITY_DN74916_c0_g1_i1:47-2056(+)